MWFCACNVYCFFSCLFQTQNGVCRCIHITKLFYHWSYHDLVNNIVDAKKVYVVPSITAEHSQFRSRLIRTEKSPEPRTPSELNETSLRQPAKPSSLTAWIVSSKQSAIQDYQIASQYFSRSDFTCFDCWWRGTYLQWHFWPPTKTSLRKRELLDPVILLSLIQMQTI